MKNCCGCLHWCVCSIREDNIRCGYFMERKKTAPKSQTNADRIRAMSDEELAELLQCGSCPHIEDECTMKGCEKCISDWLKQPVKDGDGE